MITALTIIPGATANMISRRFLGVLIASLLIGTLGTFLAVCLSTISPMNTYDPGPLVVLTLFVIFVVVWGIRHLVRRKAIIDANVESSIPTPTDYVHPHAFGHTHSH